MIYDIYQYNILLYKVLYIPSLSILYIYIYYFLFSFLPSPIHQLDYNDLPQTKDYKLKVKLRRKKLKRLQLFPITITSRIAIVSKTQTTNELV